MYAQQQVIALEGEWLHRPLNQNQEFEGCSCEAGSGALG
jgi:hypothetical protein